MGYGYVGVRWGKHYGGRFPVICEGWDRVRDRLIESYDGLWVDWS